MKKKMIPIMKQKNAGTKLKRSSERDIPKTPAEAKKRASDNIPSGEAIKYLQNSILLDSESRTGHVSSNTPRSPKRLKSFATVSRGTNASLTMMISAEEVASTFKILYNRNRKHSCCCNITSEIKILLCCDF